MNWNKTGRYKSNRHLRKKSSKRNEKFTDSKTKEQKTSLLGYHL